MKSKGCKLYINLINLLYKIIKNKTLRLFYNFITIMNWSISEIITVNS
jgi:hypothetical protein